MVADAEQAARAAHAAEIERTKADMAELTTLRDQLRSDADFLSAHLVGQRQRVTDSIAALQGVLDNPTALRPMPVPETTPVAEGDAPRTEPSGGVGRVAGEDERCPPMPRRGAAVAEPLDRDLTADDPTADDRRRATAPTTTWPGSWRPSSATTPRRRAAPIRPSLLRPERAVHRRPVEAGQLKLARRLGGP